MLIDLRGSGSFNTALLATFHRSDPASDLHGYGEPLRVVAQVQDLASRYGSCIRWRYGRRSSQTRVVLITPQSIGLKAFWMSRLTATVVVSCAVPWRTRYALNCRVFTLVCFACFCRLDIPQIHSLLRHLIFASGVGVSMSANVSASARATWLPRTCLLSPFASSHR